MVKRQITRFGRGALHLKEERINTINDQTLHTDYDPMSKLLGTSVNDDFEPTPIKIPKSQDSFYSEGESDS